jgi:glutathione S-transferase
MDVPMRLHWSPRSPFVRKIMLVLHETGQAADIEYVRNVVAMNRPNPAVMADNPLSKIPTLVLDDGTALFDSRVIAEYLDRRHNGPKLFPADQHAYFKALKWQALGDGLLDILLLWRNWAKELRVDPLAGADDFSRAFALKTAASLDLLEASVDELAAERLNIGHVTIGTALSYLDYRWEQLDWRSTRKHLAAWHAEFERRPSAIKSRISEDDSLPLFSSGERA